jgi:hypothetical protein
MKRSMLAGQAIQTVWLFASLLYVEVLVELGYYWQCWRLLV